MILKFIFKKNAASKFLRHFKKICRNNYGVVVNLDALLTKIKARIIPTTAIPAAK